MAIYEEKVHMIHQVGILGMGLWEGKAVGNDEFSFVSQARGAAPAKELLKDPFKGRTAEDGTVRINGLELNPRQHARTLALLAKSFCDPYRLTRHRRILPRDMAVSAAETEAARKAVADAGLCAGDID